MDDEKRVEKVREKVDQNKKVDAPVVIPKTATDLQRMKVEKLMENPDKPVMIPDPPKEKKAITVPEFVRNVMGSSAGAGSGEFHVYRHLRRKEYARQKYIDDKAYKEQLDEDYHEKIQRNKRLAEEKTAKKRAKRLKKKEKKKAKMQQKKVNKDSPNNDAKENEVSDSSDDDDTEEETNLDSQYNDGKENEKSNGNDDDAKDEEEV